MAPPHRTGLAPPVPPPLLQALQLDFISFPTCPGLECDARGCGWYCSPEVASSVPLYLLSPSQAFLLFSLLPLLNLAALYCHIKLAKIPCYPQKKSHVYVRGRCPPKPRFISCDFLLQSPALLVPLLFSFKLHPCVLVSCMLFSLSEVPAPLYVLINL